MTAPSISVAPAPLFSRERVQSFLRLMGPLVALGAVIAFFGGAEVLPLLSKWWARGGDSSFAEFYRDNGGAFFTASNGRNLVVQAAPVAVAALGMTVIIIAAGIDLSAGTATALASVALAHALLVGYSPLVAILTGIAVGACCGLLNGVLICSLRVVPFIVTLGTMTIYLGLAKYWADETTVKPGPELVPEWLRAAVRPRAPDPAWLLMPSSGWLTLVLAIALAVVLKYTVFGRHVFAIGSNELTARLCGVNVARTKIAIYTLGGVFLGVAGVLKFAKLSSGDPTSGTGMELRIIAAVVIGGGSLSGGRGSVVGTLAGAAIMQVIAAGCTILGYSNPIQDIVVGLVIITAVAIDLIRQGRIDAWKTVVRLYRAVLPRAK
jgi:ribose transport system permease protein